MNGRIRKEHIKKLAETPPDRNAYRRFKKAAYQFEQVGRLIRDQMQHMDAAEYLKRKGAAGGGENNSNRVCGHERRD